jgi:hypothetical protein
MRLLFLVLHDDLPAVLRNVLGGVGGRGQEIGDNVSVVL